MNETDSSPFLVSFSFWISLVGRLLNLQTEPALPVVLAQPSRPLLFPNDPVHNILCETTDLVITHTRHAKEKIP